MANRIATMPAIGMSNWSALASTDGWFLHEAGLPVGADRARHTADAAGRGIWRNRIRSVCMGDWNLAGRGECSKRPENGSTSRTRSIMQSSRAGIPGIGQRPYTADLVSQRPQLGCLLEIVETLALTLIIFVVIQNFIAQPYKVRQSSME